MHELLRRADRECFEKDAVEHTEDSGVRTDTERECDHRYCGEPRTLDEHSPGVPHILYGLFEPGPCPDRVGVFERHQRVAQLLAGHACRAVGVETLASVVALEHLAMELQLLAQLDAEAIAAKQESQSISEARPHGLRPFENGDDRAREAREFRGFLRQPLPAGRGQAVDARAPPQVRFSPRGRHPVVDEQTLQCWVERAFADTQGVARHAFQVPRDGVTVGRPTGERFKDENIERAREQL